MINCLIIDDEPLAQEIIARYIGQTDSLQLVQKCSNVIEAFNVIGKQPIDLLFLDIKMPIITGIDFIKSLSSPPAVIFTTAFSEYAVTSYELEAVDYLLKPVTYPRFKKSVERYLRMEKKTELVQRDYLYIKTDGRLIKLLYNEIIYAESMKDYMKIVTIDGKYITHLTMKALAALLPEKEFVRVHRSYMVNASFVKSVGKKDIEASGFIIPVGSNYKANTDLLIREDY